MSEYLGLSTENLREASALAPTAGPLLGHLGEEGARAVASSTYRDADRQAVHLPWSDKNVEAG